ncbi:MAG: cysteine desulfurase [Planctomycetes bacterium]|nr:cysteine desulfurase [Planctomycetota bacterium]
MIYLDNHATTRVDPRVVETMLPFFSEAYGNAGSTGHTFGETASDAVERSREVIASGIGAVPQEIVFTSGATESNNLAIRGVAERSRRRGNHLVSVQTEHQAVLGPLARLAKRDYEVTLLDVEPHFSDMASDRAGWLDPQKVADALREETVLVSVMLANNEIGVIQPLAEIGAICRERGVLLHCDATQAVGKISVDVEQLHVDLMSFSAHKMYGPKGVGALYIRRRDPIVRLDSQIVGGGQESGRRSGTLNVPGIVGFARALELCLDEFPEEAKRQADLRDQLWAGLCQQLENLQLCGPALESSLRLPGNLNVTFGDVDGEALQMAMNDLAVSSGATCASTEAGPSHVLLALGLSVDQARSSLRFGLSRFNHVDEIERASGIVVQGVQKLRKIASHQADQA